MQRHRSLPATLLRARAGLRLQSTPTAAPAEKSHYPDSSRVVCHSRSGPVRTGSPSSHQAISLAGLNTWQLKEQNKSERVLCDRLPATLGAQQPSHSSLSLGYIQSSGARHAMERKKSAGRQMQFVAGTQISLRSTAANGLSDLPKHSSPATRNPAKTTYRSHRDFCCKRLFSCTAHTRWSFTASHAFRRIFRADQTGSASEEIDSAYDSDFGSTGIRVGKRADAEFVAKQRIGPVSPFVSLVCALSPRARVNMWTAKHWGPSA